MRLALRHRVVQFHFETKCQLFSALQQHLSSLMFVEKRLRVAKGRQKFSRSVGCLANSSGLSRGFHFPFFFDLGER